MKQRATTLDTAILGLLAQSPLHGYELRKRLNLLLGSFRALSYGSLYPALKKLAARGLIEGQESDEARRMTLAAARSRIVYHLTADGKEYLNTELSTSGPAAWEDETFMVRFALFGRTDAETRLRILEGRRLRLTERLELAQESTRKGAKRYDEYEFELQRHGLERVEREVTWLDNLITTERERIHGPGNIPSAAGDERLGKEVKEQG